MDSAARDQFEAIARTGPAATGSESLAAVTAAAAALKANPFDTGPARTVLPASLAHAAFAAPEKIAAIYDATAAGWRGRPIAAPPLPDMPDAPEPIPAALWAQFWPLTADAAKGLDAGEITARTAALGGVMGPAFVLRVARTAFQWPGVAAAAERAFPEKLDVATLAACPPGSIGAGLYRLIVDNKFDLEVLDRDALGLRSLPKPLDYLNVRILQTHDLWHILAGYETTALHEIAISGFQMGQFGHNYSAMFLALVATVAAAGEPAGLPIFFDTVFDAYAHGRETPSLLDIPWEAHWNDAIADLRTRFGVAAYASPYPAGLIEQLQAMRAA